MEELTLDSIWDLRKNKHKLKLALKILDLSNFINV